MYFNPNRQNVLKFNSKIYIANKTETIQDEYLNQKEVFAKPKKYFFNVQPLTATSEITEFGELVNSMKVAVLPRKQKYLNKFHEFDKAYLDGITPDGELENGDNANYRIYAIRNQNAIIRIYFLKLVTNNQ